MHPSVHRVPAYKQSKSSPVGTPPQDGLDFMHALHVLSKHSLVPAHPSEVVHDPVSPEVHIEPSGHPHSPTTHFPWQHAWLLAVLHSHMLSELQSLHPTGQRSIGCPVFVSI
jgi:hypothetical protein